MTGADTTINNSGRGGPVHLATLDSTYRGSMLQLYAFTVRYGTQD